MTCLSRKFQREDMVNAMSSRHHDLEKVQITGRPSEEEMQGRLSELQSVLRDNKLDW